jgi:hypothetical protein
MDKVSGKALAILSNKIDMGGGWARTKLVECATILRDASKELDPLDYVEEARWSEDPKIAGALGYLEAWADVEDMTVAELLYAMKF